MMKSDLPFGMCALMLLSWVVACPGCIGIEPIGSDVPCFVPNEWTEGGLMRVRLETSDDAGRVLLTLQTDAQRRIDNDDGQQDFFPHDTVYAFDPETNSIEVVEAAVWDMAEGGFSSGDGGPSEGPFVVQGDFGRTPLLFEGQVVAVRGGTAVVALEAKMDLSGNDPTVTAVVSATGSRSGPFLTERQASGQHFHQLFSDETGEPIEAAVRIGVGGQDVGPVKGRWLPGHRFMVYSHADGDVFGSVCIFDVSEARSHFSLSP